MSLLLTTQLSLLTVVLLLALTQVWWGEVAQVSALQVSALQVSAIQVCHHAAVTLSAQLVKLLAAAAVQRATAALSRLVTATSLGAYHRWPGVSGV